MQVKEDGTERAQKTFAHVPSEIGAYEAEEIGVEHLLRDVKDAKVRAHTAAPDPAELPRPPKKGAALRSAVLS